MNDTVSLPFVITMTLVVSILGLCPPQCDRKKYDGMCWNNNTAICCKGCREAATCRIDAPLIPQTIQTVFIQDCIMEHLSTEMFANLRNDGITYLGLQNVKIESISSDAFSNMPNLGTFVLQNCNIVNLARMGEAIHNIQSSGNLSLSFNGLGLSNESTYTIFKRTFATKIQKFTLANNEIEFIHLIVFEDMRNLETLDYTNNMICNIFPPNRTMESLKHIRFNKNRLVTVPSELGGKLPQLQTLELGENTIEDLNNIAWNSFPSLRSLNLSGNHLKHLNFSLLENLSNLINVDFSNNWLSNISYNKNCTIPTVKRLSLRKNDFSIFPPWFCNSTVLPNLEHLDLSNNLIKYTITQAWECLSKLKVLDLTGNPLIKINSNTFANLNSLETLHLARIRGKLENVEPYALNNTHLRYLNLESSGILVPGNSSRFEMFNDLMSMTELNLSGNSLNKLNDSNIRTLLSPLRNIEKIHLNHVGISHLPTRLLAKFPKLTELYLDGNRFETHNLSSSFNGSKHLKYLSLANNFISVISKDTLDGHLKSTLREIDLSDNRFVCNCSNSWFRNELENSRKLGYNGTHYINWTSYRCISVDNGMPRLFKDYYPTKSECHEVSKMIIAYITIACFVFVFSVTFGTVFKFRWYFTYWRYKMNRKWRRKYIHDPERRPLRKETHDAYIIYMDQGIDRFIRKEFSPFIQGLGYSCFFWDRDAHFGDKVTAIADGIYGSRHVVAIVNTKFLSDPWSKFQIDIALDRQKDVQNMALMFIVLEDVDFQLLNTFWCVRFTKSPTVRWCSDENNIQRKAIEAQIKNTLGGKVPGLAKAE